MVTNFETEPCSRCGGTGQHSFNGEHSRCYKCDGKNGCRALTKRGLAAQAYYLDKFKLRAADVQVGFAIRHGLVKQLTVLSVSVVPSNARFLRDGVMVTAPDQILLVGSKRTLRLAPDTEVRRLPDASEHQSALADALAYQATLTKAGTVRKAAKAKGLVA